MGEKELLPCAHCGGEAEWRSGSSTTPYIRCKSCGMRTGSSFDRDRLREWWNARANALTAEQVKDAYMRHRNECLDFGERKVGWIDWQAIAEELNREVDA